MPYCQVQYAREEDSENVQIYYQTFGGGDTKVLLIMGLAATLDAWRAQILGLVGSTTPNEEDSSMETISMPLADSQCLHDFANLEASEVDENIRTSTSNDIHVCAFDNRGVGKSSKPQKKADYTTKIMAMDALSLMDHLEWRKAHVVGHSLGAMIACKLAAMFPDRIASLALLSATGGGYECLPKLNGVIISLSYRFWKAKTPEDRALVDLDTHYTKDYLDEIIGETSRRQQLYKEYVQNISASGMQSNHGQTGQINACWTHRVSSEDYERLRSSSILISVIHGLYHSSIFARTDCSTFAKFESCMLPLSGRGDVIAQARYARAIARKLYPASRLVELPGGHFITHQHAKEVNQELLELIQAARANLSHSEWQKDLVTHEEDEQDAEGLRGCCGFLQGFYRRFTCKEKGYLPMMTSVHAHLGSTPKNFYPKDEGFLAK